MERDLSSGKLAELVGKSETRTAKVVAPHTTNSYNTLSGGELLGWMDEIAAIAASRFSRYPVVTASLDRIDFKHPIPAGSIVEMVARVTRLGNTSVQVTVDVYVEYLRTSDRLHAVTGQFVMVAIGENKKPVVIDV
ncbi:MAG TPA: acyl-CoA thioesterase [Candidatus Krumholzibacteria bacterium]|nr:acyl-CoA thioesterase [Candidatus Krumholzibacteria bacterium]